MNFSTTHITIDHDRGIASAIRETRTFRLEPVDEAAGTTNMRVVTESITSETATVFIESLGQVEAEAQHG